MPGYFKNKEIASVYKKDKAIAAIYKGARLVWEAVRSCFGKGYWINTYPWSNEDGWKNNL
jgi:hypothetical protein